MQTINLKTTQKVDIDLSVTIPAFYRSKDDKEWIAIIDTDTVISISNVGNSFWISKQGISTKQDEIVKAHLEYYGCTDHEFTQKYDEVIESISKNTLLEV